MGIDRAFRCVPLLLALVFAGLAEIDDLRAAEEGYGTVTGQFIYGGKIPEPEILFAKGDPKVKDPAICAAKAFVKDDLVIDKKTGGIQHIFVYLKKAKKVHPDLKESKKKELLFDQQFCRFKPHTLLVRTDQTVRVISSDNCGHNTHTVPIRNQGFNQILPPNDKVGIKVSNKVAEPLPTLVKCDIHSWMRAYWLILDHPYAAITDKDGKFTIEKLPAGKYVFTVWHERVGYIYSKRNKKIRDFNFRRDFKVTVKSGQTNNLGVVKIPAIRFEE